MSNDGTQKLRTLLLRLLLVPSMLVGIALTWGAAWVGLTKATTSRCSRYRMVPFRVKAARDATAQYMMDNSGNCPRGIDELVSQKYLDRSNSKDLWGRDLIFHCPGTHDTDGADISSAGPDKQEGTPDDINSWDLDTAAASPTEPERSREAVPLPL